VQGGYMYDIVKEKHKGMLAAINYIALIVDETNIVDNSSYIVVHAYLLQNWERIPLILHLQKLEPGKFICVFPTHFLFIQVCFY
jgi:azurin